VGQRQLAPRTERIDLAAHPWCHRHGFSSFPRPNLPIYAGFGERILKMYPAGLVGQDAARMVVPPPIRPTVATLDLKALRSNLKVAQRLSAPAEVLAVVKANAYGHGAVPVASALEQAGVRFFGVALVEEGLALREAGVRSPILVLGGAYEGGYAKMVASRLIPVVFRPEHLSQMAAAARNAAERVQVHLKVDTGMGRIGVTPEDLPAFLGELERCPEIVLDGVLSHFANADLADAEVTRVQIRRFQACMQELLAHGFRPRYRHLSNSAGVMSLPEVRDGISLNLVRPGLMLYGVSPARGFEGAESLRPVLEWKTAITHVKPVPAGAPISYGGTWKTPRPSVIATLPVGYADGYFRALSNKGQVLIGGRRAPIVGRVCMDMTMIDVTDLPKAQVGDEVVLIGAQESERITADEMAGWVQTISYEVLCAVGSRVPRLVRGDR
jgi:alanine racemase